MRSILGKNSGFTLVEMIAVMVLVGILTAVVGTGSVQMVRGMIFTKMNAVTIQKGQMTMTKLVKEFTNINIGGITAADATSITFSSVKGGTVGTHTVMLSGNTVTFDGDILTDQVDHFSLGYYDNFDGAAQTTWRSSRRIIEITLGLKGADDVVTVFRERVKPRNI